MHFFHEIPVYIWSTYCQLLGQQFTIIDQVAEWNGKRAATWKNMKVPRLKEENYRKKAALPELEINLLMWITKKRNNSLVTLSFLMWEKVILRQKKSMVSSQRGLLVFLLDKKLITMSPPQRLWEDHLTFLYTGGTLYNSKYSKYDNKISIIFFKLQFLIKVNL